MDDKALNQMKSRLLLSARDRGFFISNTDLPRIFMRIHTGYDP